MTWTLVQVALACPTKVEVNPSDRRMVGLSGGDDVTNMASLAYGPEATRRRQGPHRRRALASALTEHGSDVMLGVVVVAFAIVLLLDVPADYNVDTWLALVDGRFVWAHGIPHRDVFNVMTLGRPWVDQQWLSQLASYAIYRLGGLGLFGAVSTALFVVPVGAAIATARRLGAPFRTVLVTIPIGIALVLPAREIRTQDFAVPLFVATVALLSTDGRRPSARVFWCIPILALWANLHGSATLGAGLVVLYAVTQLWERRLSLRRDRSAWARPLALALGAVVALGITPYGFSIVGYYHSTMVDPTLRQFVTEWQPITSQTGSTVALCLLVGACLWGFGRRPTATTSWEKLALIVLAAGSIEVIRNALFLGLFGLIVLPLTLPSLSRGRSGCDRGTEASAGVRLRANGACAGLAVIGLALALTYTIARPASSIIARRQSPHVPAVVARAMAGDPALHIVADDRYSDFLLWRDPHLTGHIAADARFELLTAGQLNRLESVLSAGGPNPRGAARGYRLLVLNRQVDAGSVKAFLAESGARVLYRDPHRIVILRTAAAARS